MAGSAESDQHRELIRRTFTEQAAAFEDRRMNPCFRQRFAVCAATL
jgi:hypothetical protein